MNNNIILLEKSKIFIGIDLSKGFHVVKAIDINGKLVGEISRLENHYSDFHNFKSWVMNLLSKCNVESAIIGMEPTGIYWQDITSYIITNMPECEAVFVSQRKVIVAREFYGNGKGKNDFIDALAIARCVKDNNYFYINPQSSEFSSLKALSRYRDDCLKRQSYIHNKLDNFIGSIFCDYKKVFSEWSSRSLVTIMSKYTLPEDILEASEEELLKQLRTRVSSGVGLKKIRQLQAVAKEYLENYTENVYLANKEDLRFIIQEYLNEYLIVQDKIDTINEKLNSLVSKIEGVDNILEIEGIGEVTVAALFSEVGDINRFSTSKQLISYIGFDLKECSSGAHKGKMKISKCGNRKLRNILFKVSLPLVLQNPYFKMYYQYLTTRTENPLKKMQALIAVCCKLIRCIHGMMKHKTKFDGSKIIESISGMKAA